MSTKTKFIWDDDNLLAEADATNTINTVYTNEPQQYGNLISSRISGTTSYHEFDALGSTRQLTNSAGGATDTMVYDAWGNMAARTGSTASFFLWIGQLGYYSDAETNLRTIRERSYSPATGRWTSVDPLAFLRLPDRYGYVSNRPLHSFDPSGTYPVFPVMPIDLAQLVEPPMEPPPINVTVCPPPGPADFPYPLPPAKDLGYNPHWCRNSSFWDPSFCDQPLSPPCKCSQTRQNAPGDQVRDQIRKFLFDQVTLCRVKVVFSPICIPGVGDPNAALTCSSNTSSGGSIICLPIGLLGSWCKLRALILHELLHAEQICDGEPIDELAAYRRQCRDMQQQRCPKQINEGDVERCARRLVGFSTDPNTIRLGNAACQRLRANNDFKPQP
jgi:RHS repeat-associated protein